MRTWQRESGQLVCRWFEPEQRVKYSARWIEEASDIQSGYIPPLPDFPSHSPFGGADWFLPHSAGHDSQ